MGTKDSDIVTRLDRWAIEAGSVPASDLMDEAAAEIERLREAIRRLADQDATLSVVSGSVIVQMDCQDSSQENFPAPENAAKQETPCPHVVGTTTQYCSLTPFALTNEEREAVEECIKFAFPMSHPTAATLRSLLARLSPPAT